MTSAAGRRVVVWVSHHAQQQARMRLGDEYKRRGVGWLVAEVGEALAARRMAKTCPRWLKGEMRRTKVAHRFGGDSKRIVWNREETRAYVVAPRDGGALWVVLTVMVPRAVRKPC